MTTNAHNISETGNGIDLNDTQTRKFIGEYLDGRRDGLLRDWTPSQYVRQRQIDEQRKLIGGLFAGGNGNDFEKEL